MPGLTAEEAAALPYGRFWNPRMAPLPERIRQALDTGPLPPVLLPEMEETAAALSEGRELLEDGLALIPGGGMRVSLMTAMPGVTPAMVDWWFRWHGDAATKYRLWHPRAHLHAAWDRPGSGYVGRASLVDEYIGGRRLKGAIRFVPPASFGVTDFAVCARLGIPGAPVEIGSFIHHVRPVAGGSEMRSRFWFGGDQIAGSGARGALASMLARRTLRFTEADARGLLVHCAEEMQHLAGFLPDLYAAFGDEAVSAG
jgi:hypothetical protein